MQRRHPFSESRVGTYARRALTPVSVVLLSLLLPRLAVAQGVATAYGAVAGMVRDESGQAVASAEVVAQEGGARALTDDEGYFLLPRIPLGSVTLHVRRLGFKPRDVTTFVSRANAARELTVVLTQLPQEIAGVEVRAQGRRYSGPMAEFNRRRESGFGGHFFTRAQIDSLRPLNTTDILRRVPSFTFIRSGNQAVPRSRDRRCTPLIWVDGTPAAAGYYDPDLINPRTIEGIEVYSGAATVPPELLGPGMIASCGAIAIWTRAGDRAPARAAPEKRQQAAAMLAALVDSVQVFTEAQVDSVAQLAPAPRFSVEYPAELRRRKASGVVVAEFVVDARGRVERPTFGVIYSPDPLFTAAVSAALESAVFKPAVRHGRSVRQLVQLPVHFVDPQSAPK